MFVICVFSRMYTGWPREKPPKGPSNSLQGPRKKNPNPRGVFPAAKSGSASDSEIPIPPKSREKPPPENTPL